MIGEHEFPENPNEWTQYDFRCKAMELWRDIFLIDQQADEYHKQIKTARKKWPPQNVSDLRTSIDILAAMKRDLVQEVTMYNALSR